MQPETVRFFSEVPTQDMWMYFRQFELIDAVKSRTARRDQASAEAVAARVAALMHYSYGTLRCACSGEQEPKFLALDHINGEGPRMPGTRSGGNVFFAWLKREGFPPGLQVLCHNCNCAKGSTRDCPHTRL